MKDRNYIIISVAFVLSLGIGLNLLTLAFQKR